MNETTINDSMPFAALTLGQAKQVICGIIAQELGKSSRSLEMPKSDVMNIDDAIVFLKENGLPITKKTLYNKTFYGTIPFRHVGKRLVFSRKELLQWIDGRTTSLGDSKADAALKLAESVRKK